MVGHQEGHRAFQRKLLEEGTLIAAGGWTAYDWEGYHSIYIFDRNSGQIIKRLPGHNDTIVAMIERYAPRALKTA